MVDYPEALLAEAVALYRDIAELGHRQQHLQDRLRSLLRALPSYLMGQYVSLTAAEEEVAHCAACPRGGASALQQDDTGRRP